MKVTVIGAGLGGLAVAARLAHAGHEVTIVERTDDVGGKLGTYVRDGLRFDTGPSLLTLPQILRDTFTATGGWPPSLVLQRISPLHRYRLADGSWTDSASLGPAWDAVLDRGRRMWEASQPYLTRAPGAHLLRHVGSLPALAPGRTLASVSPAGPLRDVLWRYATYSGSDPRLAPAVLASTAYAEHAFGGWSVEGGLHQIAIALATRCRELGAEIVLGHQADPSGPGVLVDSSPVTPVRRPSYGALAVLLPDGTPPAAHHTVVFPRDYAAEFDALRRGELPADPAIYSCTPGDGTRFVLVNAATDRIPDGTVERILERLGVQPRWWETRYHPAIYGTSMNGLLGPLRRPALQVGPAHYRVGGQTHPGGGIPLVLRSAEIVAGLVAASATKRH